MVKPANLTEPPKRYQALLGRMSRRQCPELSAEIDKRPLLFSVISAVTATGFGGDGRKSNPPDASAPPRKRVLKTAAAGLRSKWSLGWHVAQASRAGRVSLCSSGV